MTSAAPSVRSILVALDESERAPLVFATGVMMARGLGAQLFVIRVLVIPPDIPPAAHTHPKGLEASIERDARADLRRLMESHPGVEYGPPIVVVDGDPWRHIIDTAKTFEVDLIVVGSRRHHGRLDRVLGTVAARVVNHADRNVLVVHEKGADRNTAS
jgi:nucleotide-binding universal stress UspA family protein